MNQMKKEELEITISDSDRIECAIRHIQTAVDVDPWAIEIAVEAMEKEISALQAQDSPKPKAESVQNVQNEDLISRKAAIDALHTWFRDGFDEDRWWNSTHVLAALEGLPSAQPEPQWIPVSKKSHPDTPERVQVQLDNGWIITAYYEENEWRSVPYCDEPIEDRWIEAWMPLPEPYRTERRTDEGN